jgi:predicted patatin/cPLA2 family phospholipase
MEKKITLWQLIGSLFSFIFKYFRFKKQNKQEALQNQKNKYNTTVEKIEQTSQQLESENIKKDEKIDKSTIEEVKNELNDRFSH